MMPPVSRVIAQVVLAALLLAPAIAAAGPNPAELHKKARARMKSLDFEAALPLLEQLRDLPALENAVKGPVLVDLGITYVNLGRPGDARRAFDDALEATADVAFPSAAPPKIRKLFDEVKAERATRLNPPLVAILEPAPPPPDTPKLAPAAPPTVAPPPEVVFVQKERMKVVPAVLVVAGAGAIGAGVATAFVAQDADRELSSRLHTSGEAQALLSKRASFGMASYVCYGVGAAMVVAGAALFAFTGGSQQVSAVVTPGGGALTVSGAF